ncbi:hypothetical protein EJ04DRAFT_594264 [Polyplosphaeria fusca]|uniref:Zn(2)-C6 fungal-type domain-containing protein n=1 Tax=Polyplosphaeria fusca TaxID=682080 RepID=A0A9P4UWD1_9PLEO|nr:hypothetical protein EJ04DRAFT_594264 [Polyplosphaeria fusca]
MNAPGSRKPVSAACNACRRRKVKCNGAQPCPSCVSANLACTFQLAQKRGGNQGARATVLNELRETQRGEVERQRASSSGDQDASSPIQPNQLEKITIDACIVAYISRVHQIAPFLTRDILEREAQQTATSLLSRQFIISFCAYVVTFGKVLDELQSASNISQNELGKQLLDAAIQIHVTERVAQPTLQSVFVSFFLYGALAGLGNYNQAWFYLREASTLLMMQRVGSLAWGTPGIYTRLYWVVFVSERAHAIRRTRPVTLQVTPDTPSLDEAEERPLMYLTKIFRPFDDIFFAYWNGARHDCSKEYLISLDRDVRTALPISLEVDLSNDQAANLRVSQLWLRIKLWELFPRFGFLSSDSVYECLTFRYPLVIARDMMILATSVPILSFQAHGIGLTEKVFDVACALTDVLPFISGHSPQVEPGLNDHLAQITALLIQLPGGVSRFVPLLLAKVKELLPGFFQPLCEAIQLPFPFKESPMSPNTLFVYENEVKTSLYAALRREDGNQSGPT